MAKKPTGTQVNYRSAVNGQYVKPSEAAKAPREHVRETGPKLPPPKKGR